MTAMMSDCWTLTDDQLRVVAQRAGVDELPWVSNSPGRHDSISSRENAFERAAAGLREGGVLVDGVVQTELVVALRAQQRPDRELAIRMVTPDGTIRLSIVRRGTLCVLTHRVADDTVVRVLGRHLDLRVISAIVAAQLPRATAADIVPVGAPLAQMTEILSGTHDAAELADRIHGLGADSRAALLLGSALGARHAFVEIVYNTLAEHEDRIRRGRGAVALFYTKRGRIVATPSASPTGQLWTTLKAGSDHALGQAIGRLVELASASWITHREDAL